MTKQQQLGIAILRLALAATMVIHGFTRIVIGGVFPFGEFLSASYIPIGGLVAWAVTIAEIGGGIALAFGYFVVPLCIGFSIQLVMGIALVHFREGWFVVGAGRNGMEYSVLLIAAFVATVLFHSTVGEKKEE